MMHNRANHVWIVALSAVLVGGCRTTTDTHSQDPPLRVASLTIRAPVTSWQSLKEENVVMQQLDFSCGASALASLIRYYFGDPVTEDDIVRDILDALPEEEVDKRQEDGLSLLDLKQCAQRLGYQAVGARMPFSKLASLPGPVLVHMVREEYRHFSILRGVQGATVQLADPSRGNIRLASARFQKEWTGVALVLGKPGFGLPDETPLSPDDSRSILYEHVPESHARIRGLR